MPIPGLTDRSHLIYIMIFYKKFIDSIMVSSLSVGIYYALLFLQLLHWQSGAVYFILWYTHLSLLSLLVCWTKTWVIVHSCSIQNYMVQVTGMRLTICNYFGLQWLTHYGRVLFSSTFPYSPIRTAQLIYGAWAVYGQFQLLSL